jgi:hypothetical protein
VSKPIKKSRRVYFLRELPFFIRLHTPQNKRFGKSYNEKSQPLPELVLYTSLRSSKCIACWQQVFLFIGESSIPQTPLDAHFY